MKVIGLTGGIGSGKSFVAHILEKMGYPVFYSDEAAKYLTNKDSQIKSQLIQLFGKEVYNEDGLNKKFLSDRIFQNQAVLAQVNSIIHPVVRQYFVSWTMQQKSDLVFNEAAILFETGAYKSFPFNFLVTAPLELRIERVMKRDNAIREQVLARINAQMSDDEKMKLTPYIINNDEREPILSQIESAIYLVKTV
jgi:dephospho-CoA kinase